MIENWGDQEYEALKKILPREELVKIWSKIEIAKIMAEQVKSLLETAKADLEFNLVVHSAREE